MDIGSSDSSALEFLQHHSSATKTISDADVERAILIDLETGNDVNEVLITKFVRQAKISDGTLRQILHTLQGQMVSFIDTDPARLLRYTRAQLVLANELKRKASALALALRA
jgi:hypothetical protein